MNKILAVDFLNINADLNGQAMDFMMPTEVAKKLARRVKERRLEMKAR